MQLTIRVAKKIEIDETKLKTYAEKARSRFALDDSQPINMIDLLYQAQIDGDIDLPKDFDLEDYDEDLSPEEIADLAAG
jgi:hypothetical protein